MTTSSLLRERNAVRTFAHGITKGARDWIDTIKELVTMLIKKKYPKRIHKKRQIKLPKMEKEKGIAYKKKPLREAWFT